MDNKISLCMIVKDEENNIKRCLQSVQGVVDEIIVIDIGSNDKTVEIARNFGAKVQPFLWNGSFSDARNASLELATGEWVLFLDADEAIAAESGAILRQFVADKAVDGYLIKIISYMGDESCSHWSTDMVFRLFRNRPEYRFRDAVHEQIVDSIREQNSQANFQAAQGVVILHYGCLDQQIKEKDKLNRNLAIIRQEAEAYPDNRSVHYHYGVELFRVGQFEEAAREFELAAQGADPRQMFLPKLFNYLAHSYYRSGRPQQALAAIRVGLALFPDNAGLYLCGGQVSYEAKDYGLAYTFLAKGLSLPEQPDHYGAFSGIRGGHPCFYLGQLAGKFGNEEEALRYYILGLRDNPLFVTALECIIRILRAREDPAYARECLEKLCEFCSPQAYLLVAEILIGQGAFELALEYYEQGMTEHQEPSCYVLHQTMCLIQTERYLEALRLFDLFTPADPLYPVAKLNILLCFWFQGNGHIVNMLADQLFALGLSADTGAVIGLLRDTSNNKKNFSVLLGEEGMTLLLDILMRTFDLERWKYGKELLNHLDVTCLKDYGLIIGQLWEMYGQLNEAKHYVRLYLDAHPDSDEAYGTLAGLLKQTGSPLEASACYRQAIALEPREPEYYCKLYDLYAIMRQDVHAAAYYGKVIAMETQECYCQLITLYNAMGQSVREQVAERFAAAAHLMPLHLSAEN